MDKYITATEANQNLSGVLRDVAAGTTYTVTSRGKPVAQIKPTTKKQKGRDLTELIEYMKSQPIRVVGPWTREELYER
jgi:prevent-host-death family protein